MGLERALLEVPCQLAADQFEVTVRRLADDLTYGSDQSRFVGAGTDYAQTRLFAYGDSVRAIDWRVTARTGRFHVKEYESPKRVPIYLFLDTSASMGVSSQGLSKHDAAVWVASALALVALRRRSPVALVGCGGREGGIHPTLSRGQVWRWIRDLRDHSLEEPTRLSARLAQAESLALNTSLFIIISDLHDTDALPAIKRLAQRHDCVVLQLQDPAEGGGLRAGFVRGREAETATAFLTHGRTRWQADTGLRELAGAGVDHLLLRTDRPFIPALRRVLVAHGRGLRSAR